MSIWKELITWVIMLALELPPPLHCLLYVGFQVVKWTDMGFSSSVTEVLTGCETVEAG